jgi:glycosyltransferase involved in cell wall biosynthesis
VSRLRVLHMVGSLELGGAQKLTALVAAGLDRSRFEVSVLNLSSGGAYSEYLRERGVPVTDLGMGSAGGLRGLARNLRGFLRLIRFLFKRPRWDIVHTHLFRTSLLAAIPARVAGSRLFGTVHRIYYPWQPPVERLLAPLHEAIVVDSFAVGRILQAATGIREDRYVVIHNGIDRDEFTAAPSSGNAREGLSLPKAAIVITEVAHLEPHKGQLHLLRAIGRLGRDDVVLLLVGDGSSRPRLEHEVERLGLAERVLMLGARRDLPAVLAATDILALPSTFEGFGIVQAEAMYLGIPVVGGDRGGATEVIVDGVTGYLVPFGDEVSLTDRLGRLVGSADLRAAFGRAGRARVVRHFTCEAMAARYAALYERKVERGLRGNPAVMAGAEEVTSLAEAP